jgi:hypothetical protein
MLKLNVPEEKLNRVSSLLKNCLNKISFRPGEFCPADIYRQRSVKWLHMQH